MASLNKVMLIGNLGRDPEVRYTQDGRAVTNFSIATTDKWRDKATGENKERTEWHNVVTFDRLGEICSQYLSKGKQVYIEGSLQTSSYEKDGITRYNTKIIANRMQMLGSKGDNLSQGAAGGAYGRQAGGPPSEPAYQGQGRQQQDGRGNGFQQGQTPQAPEDDIPF